MTLYLLGLALAGLVASAVVTAVMRSVAPRLGLVDRPGGHRTHENATPLGGGVGIYVGLWAPVWACAGMAAVVAGGWRPGWMPEALATHAPGVVSRLGKLAVIWLAATVISGTGLVDDRRGLPALPRFVVQVAMAVLLLLCGVHISIFIDNPWVVGAITVLWIVGLTNSFNWLDIMDGLSGGVGVIVSATFLVVALQTGQLFIAAVLAALIGSLLGFLVFNWSPASIFMGDCGSMHLGFVLAALAAEFTFYQESRPLFPVIAPLLIFAVPIFDTVSVLLIRLHEGRPLYMGDNSHFAHRLTQLGMTRPQAVVTTCLVTLAIGLGATVLYYSNLGGTVVAFVQALVLIGIILTLERAAKKAK